MKPLNLRVFAKARPGAMPVPARKDVHAFTGPAVLERWGEDAAGVRALERGDNVITMFDIIGEDFWSGGGVTAKKVAAQLRAIAGPVEVQINSPGGDMFEGIEVHNAAYSQSRQRLRARSGPFSCPFTIPGLSQ